MINISTRSTETEAETRSKFIYKTIRERICLLEYTPGYRLTETVLAEEFAVSRTPIRRVLGRLESEGLVVVRHGAGNFVTDVDFDYLCDTFKLRVAVAPLADKLQSLEPTDDFYKRAFELQQYCLNIEKNEHTKAEFARINMRSFELFVELIGNQPLREMLERLFYNSARMWPCILNDSTVLIEFQRLAEEISELIHTLKNEGMSAFCNLRSEHLKQGLERLRRSNCC